VIAQKAHAERVVILSGANFNTTLSLRLDARLLSAPMILSNRGRKMIRRRAFLGAMPALAGAVAALRLMALPVAPARAGDSPAAATFPVTRSDAEWRTLLTPAQYRVLRGHGTEPPRSSPLDKEYGAGIYQCAGCATPVFSSATKFDSGTGWPSFWAPIDGSIATSDDRTWLMRRTEVHCATCGGHLGHVFDDGPPPTGLRYCINGVALLFVAAPAAATGDRT
jgi:peptide-methionine (R)-S-oxide reductase